MARIEVLPKSRSDVYIARANEFAEQMNRAAADRAWNSVGLLAVHCVVASCDALTVALAGQRWSGQDHAGVISLVGSVVIPNRDAPLRQISSVLDKKNRVEYEARQFTEKEAEEIRQNTSRVLHWVSTKL